MQALKYMILKTQLKMHVNILKFAGSHKLYKLIEAEGALEYKYFI
jgi:hypothetical protein